MSSGELRNFITIQYPTSAPGTSGDYSAGTTWLTLANVWARVIYSKASEVSTDRDHVRPNATIKIRHRTDITSKMRIVYGSETFDIEDSFDATGRGAYLMLPVVGVS